MNWSIVLFCLVVGLLPIYLVAKSQTAPLMLAKTAEIHSMFTGQSGYWLTEKYDGVRAFWDGQQLYTRQLNPIKAPYWFTSQFPNVPLDGELWIERGQFDLVSSVVRKKKPVNLEWQQVKFMVFDTPNPSLGYEQRQDFLSEIIGHQKVPWLRQVKKLLIENKQQLNTLYQQIVNAGGEGVMLNQEQGRYQTGRSSQLLKLKPFQDEEGMVVDYIEGKGRLEGQVGSLLVRTRTGSFIRVGSGLDDLDRANPPKIGEIITFRFSGLTSKGNPRFPRFHRRRPDLKSL